MAYGGFATRSARTSSGREACLLSQQLGEKLYYASLLLCFIVEPDDGIYHNLAVATWAYSPEGVLADVADRSGFHGLPAKFESSKLALDSTNVIAEPAVVPILELKVFCRGSIVSRSPQMCPFCFGVLVPQRGSADTVF